MKVVIIHTDFRIYWPARLKALATYLAGKQMELHVVEIAGAGSPYAFAQREDETDMNWHILFPERKMETLQGGEIKKAVNQILDELQPDVLTAGAIAFPSGALATAWAKKHKKKIIIFDDAKINDVPRGKVTTFIKQQIYNCVDAMLYPSADWDATGAYWGFKKEQLFYGVDVVDNEFWHEGCNEQEKENYIVAVGRCIAKKNFLFLMEGFAACKNRGDCKLLIVGDGEEKPKMERWVENHPDAGVELLPFQSQTTLRTLLHKANACVISSNKDETWGLVINEAMACSLPVLISSGCGAASTLVQPGRNGFLFNPFDLDSLVETFNNFFALTEQAKRDMGKESWHIIQEWGLSRFATGCFEAITYVMNKEYSSPSLIESLILRMWKGRYRPI